uniref:Uncharacterized protein n=1 Tax=Oryza glumipatula TaxID=40148 RepID=A0A0E0A693_9ORYZ
MGGGLSWASRPGKSRPTSKLPDSTAATLSVSSSSHFAAVVEGRRAAPPPLPIGHRKPAAAMLSRISQLGARIPRENRAGTCLLPPWQENCQAVQPVTIGVNSAGI